MLDKGHRTISRARVAHGRKHLRTVGVALAMTVVAAVAAPAAGAKTVGTDSIKINGGTADFGSGQHSLGSPQGSGTVVWDFTASGGNLNVTGHLTGTLYWDSLDPGCARLIVHFEDKFGHDLTTPQSPPDACGPGGDANLTQNQQQGLSFSYTSPLLDKIVVVTRQANPDGSLTGGGQADDFEPLVSNHQPLINSGTADFGGAGAHAFGSPTTAGEVDIDKGTNTMSAYITGRLFWDALFSTGCPRIVVDYLDVNNNLLASQSYHFCGPGGDANSPANYRDIPGSTGTPELRFSNAALYRVRLRIGSLAGSSFVNVTSVTYSFA